MDLSLHATRLPTALEKWYLDALLDDGAVVLIYLGLVTVCGASLARVTAELFLPDGTVVRGSAPARHVVGGQNELCFGPVELEGDTVRFSTAGLTGNLEYRSPAGQCVLREPFLAVGGRTLHWSVEIPDAEVVGWLRWPGGSLTVAGRGYRDRVWFDLVPWRFPIRRLSWGRAAAGTHAATWVCAETGVDVVAAAWMDGSVLPGDACGGPPPGVRLEPGRVFLDAAVAALPGLHLGPLRGIVGRLSGDAHETKWQGACTVFGTPGVAVWEVVRWRS